MAILNDTGDISQIEDSENSKQAERLFGIIEDLLSKNSLNYSDLDVIAVNIGPGSFTGVRIGLAAAKGIKLASELPLIGVSSFEAIAGQIENNDKNIVCVLDARRGQVFAQSFTHDLRPLSEPILTEPSKIADLFQLNKYICIGNGAKLIANFADFDVYNSDELSDASKIAKIALHKMTNNSYNTDVRPVYVRPPDACISRKK